MAKKIFIERVIDAIHAEAERNSEITLAFSDCTKFIINVAIRLVKESDKKNG